MAVLAACAEGSLSQGFVDPRLEAAFLVLPKIDGSRAGGAAIVVAPGIAATNKHNENLVAPGDVLARSDSYDPLFFRTQRTEPVVTAEPRLGADVVAYGDGGGGVRREALGAIEIFPVIPQNCPTCSAGSGFGYRAPGGPGFPGGPVVDAQNGAVLGLTYGYIDSPLESGETRLMMAYDMALVRRELTRLLPP